MLPDEVQQARVQEHAGEEIDDRRVRGPEAPLEHEEIVRPRPA